MNFRKKFVVAALAMAASVVSIGCSGSELTEAVVLEKLRAHENLPVPPDELKVLGITEGETERIAKVDFGGNSTNVKFRRFDTGWSPEQIESFGSGWVDFKAGLAIQAAMLTDTEQKAAVAYLRGIADGQVTYAVSCGGGFYAPSLVALATPSTGERSGFVVDDLKPTPGNLFVDKEHYRFEVKTPRSDKAPASCNGVPAGMSGATFSATAIRQKGYQGDSYQVDADGEISVIQK